MKKSVRIVGALMLLPNIGFIAYFAYALTLPGRSFPSRMGTCAVLFVIIFITAVFVSCLMGKPVLKTHPMLSGVLLLTFGLFMFFISGFSVAPVIFILAGALCIAGLPGIASGRRKESPTMKKLSRILGITGGSLSLLPYLIFIAQCLYTLSLPDSEVHFESKGYAGGFLLLFSLPALLSIAGFIGSLLVRRKRMLGAILMIVSGALLFIAGLPLPLWNLKWLEKIPPLMLIIAGALSLAYRPNDAANNEDNSERTPPA